MAHRLSYYIRGADGRRIFDTSAFLGIIERLSGDPDIRLVQVNKGDFAQSATPLLITSRLNIGMVMAEKDGQALQDFSTWIADSTLSDLPAFQKESPVFNPGLSSMNQFAATQHPPEHAQIDAMADRMRVLEQMVLDQNAALARLSEENAALKGIVELHTTQLGALVQMVTVPQQNSFSFTGDTHGHFSASRSTAASSTSFSPEVPRSSNEY